MPKTPSDDRLARQIADYLVERGIRHPAVAIVLGSGLSGVTGVLSDPISVSTADIPGYPPSTVPGHMGRIYYGTVRSSARRSQPVIVFQGRIHPYEGGPTSNSSLNVRIAHGLGTGHIILTNAAGGVRPDLLTADLMLHEGIMSVPIHPQMSERSTQTSGITFLRHNAYDDSLNKRIRGAANRLGVELKAGVYCYTSGPTYETPAEVTMLGILGADAVGMSTYPEVAEAVRQSIPVSCISLITNRAAGLSRTPLSHDDVSKAGKEAERQISSLLTQIVLDLAPERM